MTGDIETFFEETGQWQSSYLKLREIARVSDLVEEFKWYKPCYSYEGNNVFLIHGFKDYCALLFMKGVLMPDPANILVQQTENVQAGRQLRFTSVEQIEAMEPTIQEYIQAAIAVEKSGAEVEYRSNDDLEYPEELQMKFDESPEFREAFEALTPGRQKGYILYFTAAKTSQTRESRIDKYTDLIMDGLGIRDEYTQSRGLKE